MIINRWAVLNKNLKKTLWGGSCCSSSESDQLVEESPSLQTSSTFTLPSPTYATYGLTSTTNQLLHVVNKSIEAIPWHQQPDSNSVWKFLWQFIMGFWAFPWYYYRNTETKKFLKISSILEKWRRGQRMSFNNRSFTINIPIWYCFFHRFWTYFLCTISRNKSRNELFSGWG